LRSNNEIITAKEDNRLLHGIASSDGMYSETTHQDDSFVLGIKGNIWAPLFTGGLSLIASYIMLREVVVDHQNRKGNAITRLLMSMGMADLFFSLGTIMGTFASPAELEYLRMNFGTTATCDTQGFLLTLGFTASPMFVLALSYFYLLIIRYDYPDQSLQRVEFLVHTLLWAVALAVAVAPLVMGMYNNDLETCWITEHPLGCAHEDSNAECERGHGASDYAHVLAFIPLWPCMTMCTITVCCLLGTIRTTTRERRTAQYADTHPMTVTMEMGKGEHLNERFQDEDEGEQEGLYSNIDRQLSRSVAMQAVAYIAVFLLTYSAHLATTLLDWISGEWHQYLEFIAFIITMPLQGFFNCCVFMRQREMQTAEGRLFRMLFCCSGGRNEGKTLEKDALDVSRRGGVTHPNSSASRFFHTEEDGSESVSEWSY